jgi:hypothetical protein
VTGVSWESRPGRVSVGWTKQPGDACRGTAGRNLRCVRIVCWQLGDPSGGGRKDLASSSLPSGSSPCGSPEGRRASPPSGQPPTGEPCAGDPHARFGGGRDRVLNRSFLPLSFTASLRDDSGGPNSVYNAQGFSPRGASDLGHGGAGQSGLSDWSECADVMIRKAIIVVLMLAAVVTAALWADSFRWRMLEITPEMSDDVEELRAATGIEPPIRLHRGWKWYHHLAKPETAFETPAKWFYLRTEAGTITATYTCPVYYGPPEQSPTIPPKELAVPGFKYSRRLLLTGEEFEPPINVDMTLYYDLTLPLWLPFVLFAAYPTIAFVRGPLRRYRRRKRGLCVKCGYDLTGNVSGVCSECGAAATANAQRRGGASDS